MAIRRIKLLAPNPDAAMSPPSPLQHQEREPGCTLSLSLSPPPLLICPAGGGPDFLFSPFIMDVWVTQVVRGLLHGRRAYAGLFFALVAGWVGDSFIDALPARCRYLIIDGAFREI
jgi:hypothetical protein